MAEDQEGSVAVLEKPTLEELKAEYYEKESAAGNLPPSDEEAEAWARDQLGLDNPEKPKESEPKLSHTFGPPHHYSKQK